MNERNRRSTGHREGCGHRPPLQETADGRDWENRLRRLERLYIRDAIYFLSLCTEDRVRILSRDEIHCAFVQFCRIARERGAFVGKYVIMPDHLHLFVRFSKVETPVAAVCDRRSAHPLSLWVKSLKNSLSKKLRELNVPPPHWQKGFFDHVLRSEESYSEKWRYMADNPVRAGLVKQVGDWSYSGEICVLTPTRP